MNASTVQRRLAALLSADAVGYSRLMARDEAGTLATLKACVDMIGANVSRHGGRIVDAVGDNVLAEFPSVVEAVGCAAAIQRELRDRSAGVTADREMRFRIGVHVGDVVIEGERIAGDGVNVAARLEGLAEPGGVCVSGAVYEQVRDRLPEAYDDLGERSLKNIAHPVRVFRMRIDDHPGDRKSDASRSLPAETPTGFADRPAIAVLAFDNLSGDPEQEYFADGIAEDLITQLSARRIFPVIARNSSFTYRGRAVDMKQVGRELGARYLVEGSVRKAGDRVRVSAQLIDATTGHHVWADRYERKLEDIFALQDDITERIVGAMIPGLQAFEWQSSAQGHPESLKAWDCVQRAFWHWNRFNREDNAKAIGFFLKALELEPQLATAAAGLSLAHYSDLAFQWTESPERSLRETRRAAEQAVAMDHEAPLSQLALGYACSLTGERDRMIAAFESAVRYNPSFALAHSSLGAHLAIVGRAEEGIEQVETAIRLSPRDHQMWAFLDSMAHAHFGAGRYEQAIEWASRCDRERPDYYLTKVVTAAALGRLGRVDEARASLREALRLLPDLFKALPPLYSTAAPEFFDALMEGLRTAGWED